MMTLLFKKQHKIIGQAKVATRAKSEASESLHGQAQSGFIPLDDSKPQPAPTVAWEVNLGKSYMLPPNLIVSLR